MSGRSGVGGCFFFLLRRRRIPSLPRKPPLADCSPVPAADPANPLITAASATRTLADFFPGQLGIEVLEIEDDHALGRLVCERRHMHPGGNVHGGVWVAFADTVAAWGTMRSLAPAERFTTAELKCNFFGSATVGDELLATGVPLHRGSRTQVWEVRIEKAGRLVANFVCTQMVLGGPTHPTPQA